MKTMPFGKRPPLGELNYDKAPFLVIWEVTRACDLARKHCRAEAVENRHPLELSTAAIHDTFGGVAGSYDWTLEMLRTARKIGLSTQVNTTVSRFNLEDFDALAALMTKLDISLWSVFFLVPACRAAPRCGERRGVQGSAASVSTGTSAAVRRRELTR